MYFKRIQQLRLSREQTQKQIAQMLKCNRQVYARYEHGIREIPVSMLIRLAEYYQVSIDYIAEMTDVKNPYPKKQNS